jgi:hypothetical protein
VDVAEDFDGRPDPHLQTTKQTVRQATSAISAPYGHGRLACARALDGRRLYVAWQVYERFVGV